LPECHARAKVAKKWALPTFFSGEAEVDNRGDRLAKLEAVIVPVLESHGLMLVDSQWQREGRRWVLRLFVDKPGGVTVGDCQAVSREAGDVLDASGLIEATYDLEVSSPGLDRELRSDREFAWAVGRDVRCWVREPLEGRRELTGRLVGASAAALTLAEGEGRTTDVPRALVTKARLEWSSGRPRFPGRSSQAMS
jgi:ribosome maturation factor RimP